MPLTVMGYALRRNLWLGMLAAQLLACDAEVKRVGKAWDRADAGEVVGVDAASHAPVDAAASDDFHVELDVLGGTKVCQGVCTQVTARVAGLAGEAGYTWSHGAFAGPGPHEICPATDMEISVRVSGQRGGEFGMFSGSGRVLLEVVDCTDAEDAGPDAELPIEADCVLLDSRPCKSEYLTVAMSYRLDGLVEAGEVYRFVHSADVAAVGTFSVWLGSAGLDLAGGFPPCNFAEQLGEAQSVNGMQRVEATGCFEAKADAKLLLSRLQTSIWMGDATYSNGSVKLCKGCPAP